MLTLETHLYQMHLLTNKKTLTTNKSNGFFYFEKSSAAFSHLWFSITHLKQLFLVIVKQRRPSLKTSEYYIALTLFMALTSLRRRRRCSDQVKVLYGIVWLCFNQWEFGHLIQYCQNFTVCVECPHDYTANVSKMHLWSNSSTSLWLGLFHVTGIRIMRRWGGDCERKDPAQATEVCTASLHQSLVPHWMRERYWGAQNSCCLCLHEHRATCLFSCLHLKTLPQGVFVKWLTELQDWGHPWNRQRKATIIQGLLYLCSRCLSFSLQALFIRSNLSRHKFEGTNLISSDTCCFWFVFTSSWFSPSYKEWRRISAFVKASWEYCLPL